MFASSRRALRRVADKIAQCHHKHRAYQELAAMSDRELEDIGISRSDLDAIVAGRFERASSACSNVVVLDRRRYRKQPVSTKRCNERG
jgi:uncharacterized protein YjiS (DUF1127 family)